MVQSRNRKVPENWDNSWGHVVQWTLHNHRPITMLSAKYSQTPLIRTLKGPWKRVRINGVSVLSGLNLEKI